MNKEVVVFGGSGFIGSRLCSLLDTDSFKILDKQSGSKYPDLTEIVDVRNVDDVVSHSSGARCIVNLAAEHKDNVAPSSLYYDVNVDGAKHICEASEKNGVEKIVFTSTVAVYGLNKVNPDEQHAIGPFNHYGKSKYQAEEVFTEWQEKDPENRSLVIIRPTVVFGENNRGNVYNLLKQISSGKFLRIGKGENKKSMAYVGNVAAFLKHCVDEMPSGIHIFNYVDTPDLTTNELIKVCEEALSKNTPKVKIPYGMGLLAGYGFDVLAKVTGKELPVSSVRIRKFCATTQFNASKAHGTGFKPPYTLREGLDNTLKHEFQS